jgi:Bacterial Ig-like domain (group 2)/Divergent InlB B-repeat domain
MIRKWFGVTVLVITACSLLGLSSCARDQQLQGITISPATFTYFSAAPPGVQQTPISLTAYGSYIHPQENKDITSKVTWASDNTVVADVSSTGQLTDGVACGVANISASFFTSGNKNGNVVVGFMTVTVEGPASEGCPQGTATHNLSVNVTSGGVDGVITSSPTGINCGSTCSAAFAASSSVGLTAIPNTGKAFGGWAGCTTVTGSGGLTCNVTMNTDVTVSASFN